MLAIQKQEKLFMCQKNKARFKPSKKLKETINN